MNGYTFKGSNSVIFIIASHICLGHLIKGGICSLRSKFIPLRVDLILRIRPQGIVVVVVLLFYVHGKHLRSCRDGQLA